MTTFLLIIWTLVCIWLGAGLAVFARGESDLVDCPREAFTGVVVAVCVVVVELWLWVRRRIRRLTLDLYKLLQR